MTRPAIEPASDPPEYADRFGQLGEVDPVTGRAYPWAMNSFRRVAVVFWQGFARALHGRGFSDEQVRDQLQSVGTRLLLDDRHGEVERLGHSLGLEYSPVDMSDDRPTISYAVEAVARQAVARFLAAYRSELGRTRDAGGDWCKWRNFLVHLRNEATLTERQVRVAVESLEAEGLVARTGRGRSRMIRATPAGRATFGGDG